MAATVSCWIAVAVTAGPATVVLNADLYLEPEPRGEVDWGAIRAELVSTFAKDKELATRSLRLGWHAAATWDPAGTPLGGLCTAGATMRFEPERSYAENRGLAQAIDALSTVTSRHPGASTADVWTLASYVAIEELGGPRIEFAAGRVDGVAGGADCPPENRLPFWADSAETLQDKFRRLGMNNREMVALLGAHTVGHTEAEHSGFPYHTWDSTPERFDALYFEFLLRDWWVYDDEDPEHPFYRNRSWLMLLSDWVLRKEPELRSIVKEFAADEVLWHKEFANAFRKLTEAGCTDQPSSLLPSSQELQRCHSAEDCSFNGRCLANKTCACIPAFTGERCDRFNFLPLNKSYGVGLKTVVEDAQVSSWGGSVLWSDDDGALHMYAAEMTESTGIKAWITNSQVVHAVADSPGAPFKFNRKKIVQPVFAHEPTVSRAPSGEYVMFYTTNYGEPPGSQCNQPCTCGNNGTSCLSCPNDQQCHASPRSPLSTRMIWSKSPYGPWSEPVLVPSAGGGDTNLACTIHADESIVCLGRPDLGGLVGSDWRNVSTYAWRQTQGVRIIGEDPMIWYDMSGVLHAVTHGGGWGQPFGYSYWSLDHGLTWNSTGAKVYENIVELASGGSLILSRRERPHVILSPSGQPIALTNGVTEAWPCTLEKVPDRSPCKHPPIPGHNPHCGPGSNGTSIWCPVDYSWTLVQKLQT